MPPLPQQRGHRTFWDMRNTPRLFHLLVAVALLAAGRPLAAQAPGDSVRLVLRDGPVVRGILMARTAEAWRLAVPQSDDQVIADADLRRRERQIVRSRSALRSQSMLIGMLTGGALMFATYQATIGAEPGDPGLGGLVVLPMVAVGVGGGGVAGLVVGSFRSERVWREIP